MSDINESLIVWDINKKKLRIKFNNFPVYIIFSITILALII